MRPSPRWDRRGRREGGHLTAGRERLDVLRGDGEAPFGVRCQGSSGIRIQASGVLSPEVHGGTTAFERHGGEKDAKRRGNQATTGREEPAAGVGEAAKDPGVVDEAPDLIAHSHVDGRFELQLRGERLHVGDPIPVAVRRGEVVGQAKDVSAIDGDDVPGSRVARQVAEQPGAGPEVEHDVRGANDLRQRARYAAVRRSSAR